MHKIHIRPLAKKDIKKIWRYTNKNWGEQQADVYTDELGQAIDSLIDNPEIGIDIAHIKDGYRLFHVKHHYIIYHQTPAVSDIVRVLGESMDINRHL